MKRTDIDDEKDFFPKYKMRMFLIIWKLSYVSSNILEALTKIPNKGCLYINLSLPFYHQA